MMRNFKRRFFKRAGNFMGLLFHHFLSVLVTIRESGLSNEFRLIKDEIRQRDPDAFVLSGYKVYSQCDEDGIIERIFEVIGEKTRLFVEIGCGNGLENNTHYLLLKDWRGVWIDGDPENVAFICSELGYQPNNVLSVCEAMIGIENVNSVVQNQLEKLGISDFPVEIDFLSLDIDGNDLYVVNALEVVKPRVICIEYNAKFPPPATISIKYRRSHKYAEDDYQGASLQSIFSALEPKGYRLVACGISGVNAFFVKASELPAMKIGDLHSLYQPPRHYLTATKPGLTASLKFVRDRIFIESK